MNHKKLAAGPGTLLIVAGLLLLVPQTSCANRRDLLAPNHPDPRFAIHRYIHVSREFAEFFNQQMTTTQQGETPSFLKTVMEGQRNLGSYWRHLQVVDVREKQTEVDPGQTRAKQKAVECSQKNLEALQKLLRLYEKRHQALKHLP